MLIHKTRFVIPVHPSVHTKYSNHLRTFHANLTFSHPVISVIKRIKKVDSYSCKIVYFKRKLYKTCNLVVSQKIILLVLDEIVISITLPSN